ncbi:MAG: hypothetical protein CVV10_04340 [Gammaproteobacteria bacterium HGW-Gammaproteobacteria-14]|nr:MAG: hypothetical protein CVV10_04340 [Gammaproteobacteria bacterium HGW-Gammaproteobacteria-14]
MQTTHQPQRKPLQHIEYAALISADGRETPITEEMIRQACETLEHHWQYPKNQDLKNEPPAV